MPPLPACAKLKLQQTIDLSWSRDSRFREQKSLYQLIKSHDSGTIQDIIATRPISCLDLRRCKTFQ